LKYRIDPTSQIEQLGRALGFTRPAGGKDVMRQRKVDDPEISVYPPLALTPAVAAWRGPHSSFHLGGLAEFLMGDVIWTLVEYRIYRVLLHSISLLKRMHTVAVWDRLLGAFIEPSTPNLRPWRGSQVRS
jgi:hypothetical protein